MTKIELIKTAANIVVGAGTTKIVTQVIKNNTNPETVADIVTMTSAGVVIGAAAADVTKSYTNAKIDAVADWWKTNVTKN